MRKRRTAERETPAAPSGGPARVLVVNDDPDACELLVRLLTRAGYPVDRAHDHIEAIAQVTLVPPACVVLDLSTGGVGANLKLLDSIRTHHDPRVSNSRVVLVAKKTNNQMFSWQSGVDSFLLRPFEAGQLLVEVADVLQRPDEQRARHRRDRLHQTDGTAR